MKWFVIVMINILAFGCGNRTPEAFETLQSPSQRLSHSTFTECNVCHADTRPPAPHPTAGDCVQCHKFPTWDPI
ncbi:MAG: hypothetical protein HRU19_24150 [Pseudobacteriovorax sp.]|nr:hypothetical protein [Pseudobacteriovorax sp.]